MKVSNSVEIENLTKSFTVKYTTIYGGIAKSGKRSVLNGVSFHVRKGEVLGIIGKNGCGKSTLLKIITGIMEPDSGSITIDGRVASILELNMGFDAESSGRDNIRIKCELFGLSKEEIEQHIDEIVNFSELGEQIDYPLRTYSSGMIAKLAFSVLLFVKCDVLVLDEVLSVGDASFNAKCRLIFQKIKKTGKSIILASHNIATLEKMCDRVLWIDEGKVKEIGEPASICYKYRSETLNSIDVVMKNAELGDISSINRMGELYRDGITVDKDINKAEFYFKKASDMGNIDAQINLANLLLKRGERDNALVLLNKASVSGNPIAISLYMRTKGDNSVQSTLDLELRELANEGNTRAMKMLADLLFSGNVLQRDYEEAVLWYKKCSEYYDNQAEYQLGICYRDGLGTSRKIDVAVNYLRRSSEHGNMRARLELANMYRKGIGVDSDMLECIKWYQLAADTGDINSMLQLGLMYRDGVGVEQDLEKAEYWMDMYSMQSIVNAELTLGDIYKQGYTLPIQKKCIGWYEAAAACGNIRAINALASIYRDGLIELPDYSKAKELLDISSEKYSSSAKYELAMMFLKGIGVKQDVDMACTLLSESSKMRHIDSMLQLVRIYACSNRVNEVEHLIQILEELGNNTIRMYRHM